MTTQCIPDLFSTYFEYGYEYICVLLVDIRANRIESEDLRQYARHIRTQSAHLRAEARRLCESARRSKANIMMQASERMGEWNLLPGCLEGSRAQEWLLRCMTEDSRKRRHSREHAALSQPPPSALWAELWGRRLDLLTSSLSKIDSRREFLSKR